MTCISLTSLQKMSELSVIVIAFHQCVDVLKRTLPASKAALPRSRFFVATSTEDKEVLALCNALNVETIQFGKEVINKDGAVFNFAGIARSSMTFVKTVMKKDLWILITRPQVMLDSRLSELDFKSLAKDSLYGCGIKEVLSAEELASFKPSEPSSLEVRDLVPTSSFLLSFSAPPRFDAWSTDTQSGVHRFSACFVAKYMIHLNIAYLGIRKQNDDSKVSIGVWGHTKTDKLRIEPVHAFAAQQEEEASEPKQVPKTTAEPVKDVKKSKLFGLISGDDEGEFRPRTRTELDAQQNVATAPFPVAESEVLQVKSEKKSIWNAKVSED
jgi:hypothetical protein